MTYVERLSVVAVRSVRYFSLLSPFLLWLCTSATAPVSFAQSAMDSTPAATTVPAVTTEAISKAYMNCLVEVDKAVEELGSNRKARQEEGRSQLKFCENRKRDCVVSPHGSECRTFVEEFTSEQSD